MIPRDGETFGQYLTRWMNQNATGDEMGRSKAHAQKSIMSEYIDLDLLPTETKIVLGGQIWFVEHLKEMMTQYQPKRKYKRSGETTNVETYRQGDE